MDKPEKTPTTVNEAIALMVAYDTTIDYAPVRGGRVIVLDNNKNVGVSFAIFDKMDKEGLIEKHDTLYNWHPVFRPSSFNPVQRYTLTEKGRNVLNG
jgi:hypothetical protein